MYIRENGREDRKHNIAEWMLSEGRILAKQGGDQILRTYARDLLRVALGLLELLDKAKIGDYKAHGDAAGGHGLGLETGRVQGKYTILLNEVNFKKCEVYLSRRRKLPRVIMGETNSGIENELAQIGETPEMSKRTGKPVSDDERSMWHPNKLMGVIGLVNRRDPGGQNGPAQITKKLIKYGVDPIEAAKAGVVVYEKIMVEMQKGVSERQSHSKNEMKRRVRFAEQALGFSKDPRVIRLLKKFMGQV